jgi:hypothetical protein
MSAVNGNPFWMENRRLFCGNGDPWLQHFCPAGSQGESGNQCGVSGPGGVQDSWRVLSAPEGCGDITLTLCGRS